MYGRILSKISDRNIGIFGAILGVVGLVLSIYFYYASIAERRPIFLLDETSRAVVVAKAEMPQSAITITRADGKQVASDVNIAKFYFWNDGTLPIKREDVLKPVRLRVQNGEILSFKLLKMSRDVVGAEFTRAAPDSIIISANILERSDGVAGQLVYEGPRDAKVLLDGVIQGVGEIDFCSCIVPKKPWYLLLSASAYLLLLFLVLREGYVTWKNRATKSRSQIIVLGLISALLIGGITHSLYRLHTFAKISAEPPSTIFSSGSAVSGRGHR